MNKKEFLHKLYDAIEDGIEGVTTVDILDRDSIGVEVGAKRYIVVIEAMDENQAPLAATVAAKVRGR